MTVVTAGLAFGKRLQGQTLHSKFEPKNTSKPLDTTKPQASSYLVDVICIRSVAAGHMNTRGRRQR